mgnify:CR=1 FL=1
MFMFMGAAFDTVAVMQISTATHGMARVHIVTGMIGTVGVKLYSMTDKLGMLYYR